MVLHLTDSHSSNMFNHIKDLHTKFFFLYIFVEYVYINGILYLFYQDLEYLGYDRHRRKY
jgi:hypothetical protein